MRHTIAILVTAIIIVVAFKIFEFITIVTVRPKQVSSLMTAEVITILVIAIVVNDVNRCDHQTDKKCPHCWCRLHPVIAGPLVVLIKHL